METGKAADKVDIGRLTLAPIFALLMVLGIFSAYHNIVDMEPLSATKVAKVTNQVLVICFYILIILLYFIRHSSKSASKSLVTSTVAIAATFLPFALVPLGKPLASPVITHMANFVVILGMAFSIFALGVLGKSFSIIPQARALVRSGPYRFVRHPLYLGELISAFGITLARPTAPAVAVFLLLVASQTYRALQEENLLTSVFPEYDEYRSNTSRFIPGIF